MRVVGLSNIHPQDYVPFRTVSTEEHAIMNDRQADVISDEGIPPLSKPPPPFSPPRNLTRPMDISMQPPNSRHVPIATQLAKRFKKALSLKDAMGVGGDILQVLHVAIAGSLEFSAWSQEYDVPIALWMSCFGQCSWTP